MKLVMITPYYPPIRGGVTTYVVNLTNTIKTKYNISVNVIAREGESGIDTTIINSPKWLFALRAFFVLCKIRPDVIHSHSWWYTLFPSIFYKFTHPKTKVVHTLHTEPAGEVIKSVKNKIFGLFLSRCDMVTFVSKSQMEKIEKYLTITTPKTVIYAGVTQKNVDEKEVAKIKNVLRLDKNHPVISFIGPLVHEKKAEGVEILIKSVKIVKIRYPQIKLLIIGDGEFRKNLEERVNELNIKDNVVFMGFREDVFAFLALTDIYAHISLQEALGMSLLEAMIMGIPSIAANTGGIPEIIKSSKNGVLVEPDPEAIAEAIIRLYEDKEMMKEMGENARIDVEMRFALDRLADEFVKIYTE